MNDTAKRTTFEERRLARVERFKELAEKAEAESKAAHERASEMASCIPFGQPILVGHHSEKRDRRFRDRIHNLHGKGFNLQEKAEYYAQRAKSAENNRAIYSDDPEAVRKLKEKLVKLQKAQKTMKAINAAWGKAGKPAGENDEAWQGLINDQELKAQGITEKMLYRIKADMIRDPLNRAPFTWGLSNNNQEINRVKKRIEQLQKQAERVAKTHEIDDIQIIENVEANRVQIIFPDIPPEETRRELKAHGFRWSRYNKAWQRHLKDGAVYVAKKIVLRSKGLL